MLIKCWMAHYAKMQTYKRLFRTWRQYSHYKQEIRRREARLVSFRQRVVQEHCFRQISKFAFVDTNKIFKRQWEQANVDEVRALVDKKKAEHDFLQAMIEEL